MRRCSMKVDYTSLLKKKFIVCCKTSAREHKIKKLYNNDFKIFSSIMFFYSIEYYMKIIVES